MGHATPLLTTKLHPPPPRAPLVPRPHLLARLEEGSARRLTLVAAPAGFGKSTLVAAWLRSRATAAAWLSLEAADNDPVRFWRYLLAALQRVQPTLGHTTDALLAATTLPPVATLLTPLLNELQAAPETRLVLDDYHEIHAPAIHEGVAFLLEHAPPAFRLILATRREPPLPLARLRARHHLTSLHAADLRFNESESDHFLSRVMGLALDEASRTTLAARTEGWVAGLQLAALALQGEADPAAWIDGFSGNHRHLRDFLAEELFAHQPPSLQRFLLHTAPLTRLSAPLCEALTGEPDAQATLEAIERANLFLIPLDEERRWYRYHPLFRDFLRAQLRRREADALPVLHHRAAHWLAEQGAAAEAIPHALAADAWALAAELIAHAGRAAWMRSELATLRGWLDALPPALLTDRVELALLAGWAAIAEGRGDQVPIPRPPAPHLAEWLALQATSARLRGDATRTLALAAEAASHLPPEDPLALRPVLALNRAHAHRLRGAIAEASAAFGEAAAESRALGHWHVALLALHNLAWLHLTHGRRREAERLYRQSEGLIAAEGVPRLPAPATLHLGLGELRREADRLAEATSHLRQAIALDPQGREARTLLYGMATLARVQLAQGEAAAATATLQEAHTLAQAHSPTVRARLAAWAARLALARGQVAEAARWAARLPAPARLHEDEALTLARLWLAQGRPGEAHALVMQRHTVARERGRLGRVAECDLLAALALQQQGKAGGVELLLAALHQAAPEGFLRLFLDEGPPLVPLLRQVQRDPAAPSLVATLLAALPDAAQPIPLQAPLHEREQEILRLLAVGHSNQRIADELMLAPSTIKWYLKQLYSKLAVHNRTQAVARAHALGLI